MPKSTTPVKSSHVPKSKRGSKRSLLTDIANLPTTDEEEKEPKKSKKTEAPKKEAKKPQPKKKKEAPLLKGQKAISSYFQKAK